MFSTLDYLLTRKWSVASGAAFTDLDVEQRNKVALLGAIVAEKLFGDDDPVDRTVRVGLHLFKVVGVLQAKRASTTGQNQDDFVLIPYRVAQRNFKGTLTVDDVMCSATSDAAVPLAQEHVTTLMRDLHRIAPG